MKTFFFLIPFAIVASVTIAQTGLPAKPFTIVTSGIIRINSPYTVAVKRYGSISTSFFLKLTINGTTASGTAYSAIRNVSIAANVGSGSAVFDTSAMQQGSYNLFVEGEGYSTSRQLIFPRVDSSILVQLEKPIYIPGELVKFRVFAFDSNTNAISPSKNCSVIIRNSAYILIEKYENFAFVKGKYEGKLQLGEKALEGIYSLEAYCGDEFNRFVNVYETFEVAIYELPAFYVNITIPTQVPYSNGKVPVSIRANYPSRDPVEGTAILQVDRWGQALLTRQVTLVKGVSSFDLLIPTELQATDRQSWYYYEYTLTLTDSLLNTNVVSQGNFQILPYKFITQFTGNQFLTPGSTYTYTISIKTESGVSAPSGTKVNVTIAPYCQPNIAQNMTTLSLGTTGTVSGTYLVPKGCNSLSLTAIANDSNTGYWWASAQQAGSGFLGVYPSSQNGAKFNQPFEVKVAVNGTVVKEVNYVVASKGVVLESKSITITTGSTSGSIWITPSSMRYVPMFTVTAWYLNGTDFVAGQAYVQIRDRLNNYVKFGANATVAPGAISNLTVNSKCDSTVSFAAVDQRVFQLTNKRNVIFLQDVLDAAQYFEWYDWIQYDWSRPIRQFEYSFINSKLFFISNINDPALTTTTTTTTSSPFGAMAMDGFAANTDFAATSTISGTSTTDLTKIRRDFLKSFLWTDVLTNVSATLTNETLNCQARVNAKVSDEISSYIIYGVSMNTKHGIGLSDIPASITTSLAFSINANLPITIKRNEVLILDIPAFNSITQDQNVTFTVIKDSKYSPVDLTLYGWKETTTGYDKIVLIRASQDIKVQFALKFNTTGNNFIQIRAKGPLAGDAIEKSTQVIFEGIPRAITSCLLTVGYEPSEADLYCNYPEGVYEDSKSVLATVIGDIMGNALNNLEKLIVLPTGCAEQTLLRLMPDMVILRYLIATNKLTTALDEKLKLYISSGVQSVLSFIRNDTSFPAFRSDVRGSVWLTTYAALSLYRAKAHVTVDEAIIRYSFNFVVANQQTDGSFIETGYVYTKDMQGGTGNGIAMNAYIAIALTEILNDYPEFTDARDAVVNFLVANLTEVTTPYELAITTYALLVSGHFEAQNVLDALLAMGQESTSELLWLTQTLTNSKSLLVEITSYGLLSLTYTNDIHKALKVARFLIKQENQYGGFGTSQDTVIALTALARFASNFFVNGATSSLTLTPNVGPPAAIQAQINTANSLTLQQFQLNANTSVLNVKPSQDSTAIGISCLICNFYQDPSAVIPNFNVTYAYERQCRWQFTLNVCVNYIPEGSSNMAIVTATFPTGFLYYEWANPINPLIAKVEPLNSGSSVVFYFISIGNEPICFKVTAYRNQEVTQLKGGIITATDYYNPFFEGSVKYPAPGIGGVC